MLKIQQYIIDNINYAFDNGIEVSFKEELIKKPYCLKIQEDDHFMLLKYNQIDSDFQNELVRECRGIILDKHDWSVACHPFHKFGNYGESYVPEMDWTSASVQEKLDGSLIKCWYNKYTNKWQWSTNGTIDAFNASLADNIAEIKSFGDLILYTLILMENYNIYESFDKAFTYLFELCTPFNRVVVPHNYCTLYHLVTKHNLTEAEDTDFIGLPQPKRYPMTTLEECIESAKTLPFNEEGYVVVDKYLNRVKIKSPAYLAVHHLKGEGSIVPRRALDLIRTNEHNELLGYFPEYKEYFDKMEEKYRNFIVEITADLLEARTKMEKFETRKEFAMWAKDQIIPAIMFSFYDGKIKGVVEALEKVTSENLLRYLK